MNYGVSITEFIFVLIFHPKHTHTHMHSHSPSWIDGEMEKQRHRSIYHSIKVAIAMHTPLQLVPMPVVLHDRK